MRKICVSEDNTVIMLTITTPKLKKEHGIGIQQDLKASEKARDNAYIHKIYDTHADIYNLQ